MSKAISSHQIRILLQNRGILPSKLPYSYPDRIGNKFVSSGTLYCYSGWVEYSAKESHHHESQFLVGKENGHFWAVRIPPSCKTAQDAKEWLMLAKVKKARKKGELIGRQGDIFLIVDNCNRGIDVGIEDNIERGIFKDRFDFINFQNLHGTRHKFVKYANDCYALTHPEHKPLSIPPGIVVEVVRAKTTSPIQRRMGD